MEDLISRQAALDALNEQIEQCDKALSSFDISMKDEYAVKVERASLMAYKKTLEYMPSAQPELIRCKDCKWYGRADKRRFYRGMDCLQKRIDTIVPDKDFCSRAERRTDEPEK